MTNKMLYVAETWDKVYVAFEQINFTAYDYDAVKQSLLDYLKLNYPETFNDYIESSQLVAIIELFAYIAEQYAYRIDMSVHENMLSTAQRKQSILRLAKLVSYTASRNLPLRGLVKVTSMSTSEDVRDSQGNILANKPIRWNDPSNPLWKEQFLLVANRILTNPHGNPHKAFQVGDVAFQQYETSNLLDSEIEGTSFVNGTLPLTIDVNGTRMDFELVPADIDDNGVFERAPNPKAHFNVLFANDGFGDSSDMTGMMLFLKQGKLQKIQHTFDSKIPNRIIDIDQDGINDVDVWLHEVTADENIIAEWEPVNNINGVNLAYNSLATFKKYEIETLENDAIRLVFGSGDFSDIPTGYFNIWVRTSSSGGVTVSKEDLSNYSVTFAYTSKSGKRESCTMTISLVSALQNSAASEDIEHIRSVAPAVYYTQNRMVNGQDYNSYMLQDSSILKLQAVNRTFAGQPKYLEWNDASGTYQNVKIFGDDLRMYYDMSGVTTTTKVSARSLINDVIEPALAEPGVYNLLAYAFFQSSSPLNQAYVRPRVKLIEDSTLLLGGVPLLEKTEIQGALDRHWYGEPDFLAYLGPDLTEASSPKTYYGVINGDNDKLVYDANLKLVTKDSNGVYHLVNTPNNVSGVQEAVTRQRRFGIRFNPDRQANTTLQIGPMNTLDMMTTTTLLPTDINQLAAKAETFTIEIVNAETGTFTVTGSKSGVMPMGVVGSAYSNGLISFVIKQPINLTTTVPPAVGDAFIISLNPVGSLLIPQVYKRNLLGRFELIDENDLPSNAEVMAYDVNVPSSSWVMIIERNDDTDGNVAFWRVTRRNFRLVVESPTTHFWFNKDTYLVDPDTKTRVADTVKLLKSNLNTNGVPLGVDQPYFVVDLIRHADGDINQNSLQVSPSTVTSEYMPSDGRPQASMKFLSFIGQDSYVYFNKDATTGKLTPIPTTAYLQSLNFTNDESGTVVRKLGREALDFLWIHYASDDHLIDPSTSNIIDMFVLTRGFYARMNDYLRGVLSIEPVPPSSFELRTSYRKLLESKMLSDTVVMHPAKVKLLFGSKAAPELRAKFKLVKSTNSKLTDDQLRIKTLDIINQYFSIGEWEFGQAFYATELCAVIHQALALDVASVVLVPEFPTNYYGDLLHVRAESNEILMTAAELKDIQIINDLNRITLRQK
jgi:hypothetical protein